jgi:hypothetical protein
MADNLDHVAQTIGLVAEEHAVVVAGTWRRAGARARADGPFVSRVAR